MNSKICFAFSVFAVFVQTISAACIGNVPLTTADVAMLDGQWIANDCALANSGIGFGTASNVLNFGIANGCNGIANWAGLASAGSGSFPVSSASPIFPTGVSVLSENGIEGIMDVAGQLPFLSAVALEGQIAAGGAAATQYACGDGNVRIVSEGLGMPAGLPYAGLPTVGMPIAGVPIAGMQIAGYSAPFTAYTDGFINNAGCGSAPIVTAYGNRFY